MFLLKWPGVYIPTAITIEHFLHEHKDLTRLLHHYLSILNLTLYWFMKILVYVTSCLLTSRINTEAGTQIPVLFRICTSNTELGAGLVFQWLSDSIMLVVAVLKEKRCCHCKCNLVGSPVLFFKMHCCSDFVHISIWWKHRTAACNPTHRPGLIWYVLEEDIKKRKWLNN